MSKKETKPVKSKANGKKSGVKGFIGALILGICAVVVMPTTLIFVVGMIPTAVAYFVDSGRERALGPTVCFLNFAGVLPALMRLWQEHHTIDAAVQILSQPMVYLIMLVPASLGWMLYAYTPQFVGSLLRRKAENRVRALEKEQEYLVTTWGSQVTTINVERLIDISNEEIEEDHLLETA